ncbi:MAG: TolC family protein [Deltaproteobacteria bacterium]|nr:TolC family protein [Deltaproteobacteria bacterium]
MQLSWLALATVIAAPALAASPAAAAPAKLTLDQLIARATSGPRAAMAATDTARARARADEASAARAPKLTAQGFLTISPEIRCVDVACTQTAPDSFEWKFSGAFGGGSLLLTQPIYTFGKIATARDAAKAGVTAQTALENETAGDAAIDAARAYWGLKLARELRYMLEDGIDELAKAHARMDERATDDSGDVTIQDRQRLATIEAEAALQLEDATQGEEIALASVRALAGDDTVDIDDAPMAAIERDLGPVDELAARARADRPQAQAARAGADAAHALAAFEARQYFPDLAIVGTAEYAEAQGVDHPPSWIYSQPYHKGGVGAALILRWQLEPWTTHARVERAEAEAHHADALAAWAEVGATLEARTAHTEAARAKRRIDAATKGEEAARTWVASVVQSDAIGTSETKDLADAYLAWFQMRARLMNAIFQWNVAAIRLDRATGEFHPRSKRP